MVNVSVSPEHLDSGAKSERKERSSLLNRDVAPPKRAHHGPDKHTKPPGERVYNSGGHRSRGSGHVRGAKTPAFGGERRQFERRSGGNPDSQKKIDQGWGTNEGEAELSGK